MDIDNPLFVFLQGLGTKLRILNHSFGTLQAYFALGFDFGPKCKIMLGIRHKIRHGQANLWEMGGEGARGQFPGHSIEIFKAYYSAP